MANDHAELLVRKAAFFECPVSAFQRTGHAAHLRSAAGNVEFALWECPSAGNCRMLGLNQIEGESAVTFPKTWLNRSPAYKVIKPPKDAPMMPVASGWTWVR